MNALAIDCCALTLTLTTLQAATPPNSDSPQELQQQLEQLQESLRRSQNLHREQIEELTRRLHDLEQAQTTSPPAEPQSPAPAVAEPSPPPAPANPSWSPANPIQLRSGNAYLNLSFDALFAAGSSTANDIEGGTQLGGHDPKQRGFTVQNLELTLDGNVDPYFRGQAALVLQIDPEGETTVEAEEAYLETIALPANLQLKAGQYFTEFGRLNPTHPHTWSFVDQPLINGRFFGEDGLRNPGARVSWLVPLSFYSELFFGVQNSHGATAASFRNDHGGEPYLGRLHDPGDVKTFTDLLLTTRYAASFDFPNNQTVLTGVSAAFGPNGSGADTDTQIYGLDLFWKWKSPRAHAGFPFVSWQTEAMLRRYEAGAFSEDLDGNGILDAGEPDLNNDGLVDAIPRETLTDFGFYTQVLYGFRKGWVAGLRGDYLTPRSAGAYEAVYGPDPERASRWRLSPNLTYYPTEYSKFRLQYNYDDRDLIGVDHSVWLQFEFLLGSHAAHKF